MMRPIVEPPVPGAHQMIRIGECDVPSHIVSGSGSTSDDQDLGM
jgi:hypothetical protein